jgi:hypothetical protein
MARAFNVDARVSSFELPALTKQQIQALILDLDLDARSVIILAVAELWQREIGEPDRDIYAELDAIKAKIGL